jgi:glycosyltransferase involved in cell wall biosynthesis
MRPLPVDSSYLRMLYALPRLCRQIQANVVHVQYTAPFYSHCPYVASVHDLVGWRLPETMPPTVRWRLRHMTGYTVRNAARVFVLTRAIQRDIMATYGIAEDKFDLVQPAVDTRLYRPLHDASHVDAVRARYGVPAEYVLYVGLIQPRKNLHRLAQAFARLVEDGYPHSLVIVGKRAWMYDAMLDEVKRLGLDKRLVFTDYVAREDLPVLYSGAAAFAYPSLYEGFGIPVLEALACGTPVLTSTDPALVEVAGGAALHANAYEVDELHAGLTRILSDSALRQKLIDAGPERAAHFSAQKMAAAAVAGYRKAMEG